MKTEKTGKVWLVGAGPSDPGLMTVKGKKVLEEAQVVLYDRLIGPGILAMIPQEAEAIDVGKRSGDHPVPQEEITRLIAEKAREGKRVVRLKGGDPFMFGRGGEELEPLAAEGIPFEIVPGITSGIAAPAYAGIPVTHRDYTSSVHFITAHKKRGNEEAPDFETLARLDGTLLFYMGLSMVGEICKGLMDAGMDGATPAAVIDHGTSALAGVICSDLAHLEQEVLEKQPKSPAMILVGRVAALSESFAWAEKRPLGKTRVIVTRPKKRSRRMADALEALGAEVVVLPAIETKPLADNEDRIRMIKKSLSYDWIGFTSAEGVDCYFDMLKRNRIDIRKLFRASFAAIGPGTAKALEARGIMDIIIPSVYEGSAMAWALIQEMRLGEKIFLPRASEGTKDLLIPLEAAGIEYEDFPMYDTAPANISVLPITPGETDLVTFTSASTVRGFKHLFPELDYTRVHAVCIGKQTAAAAEALGMKTTVSREATIDSMIETIMNIAKDGEN